MKRKEMTVVDVNGNFNILYWKNAFEFRLK